MSDEPNNIILVNGIDCLAISADGDAAGKGVGSTYGSHNSYGNKRFADYVIYRIWSHGLRKRFSHLFSGNGYNPASFRVFGGHKSDSSREFYFSLDGNSGARGLLFLPVVDSRICGYSLP